MKVKLLFTIFIILISQSAIQAASPDLAGAKCSTVGAIKQYQNKKYTCIKVGKNLQWSKGSNIIVLSKKIPNSILPPIVTKPEPISENIDIYVSGYGTYYGELTQGDEYKEDSIKIQSSVSDFELRVEVRDLSGKIFILGTPKLEWKENNESYWIIKFPEASKLIPGKYTRNFYLVTKTGTKKDIWKSDFLVKPIQLDPNFKFGLEKTCGDGIRICPSAIPEGKLLEVQKCKIADATFPFDSSSGSVSSGFPPPSSSLAGKKNVTLLVLPITFRDRPISDALYQKVQEAFHSAENFYRFNSFDRINFNFEVLKRDEWVYFPKDYSDYESQWKANGTDVTQYLLDQFKLSSSRDVDAIMWLLPSGKYDLKTSSNNAPQTYDFLGKKIPSVRVYGLHNEIEVDDSAPVVGTTHGLGHALYSFEDLYIFSHYSASGKNEQPGNGWDVMIGGGDFFSWSKWIAGWLKDSEVSCLSSTSTEQVVYIRPTYDYEGKKLIAIPLGNFEILLAEYRTNASNNYLKGFGLCASSAIRPCSSYMYSGLLLYKLDTKIKHGAAPIRVAQEIDKPLLKVGEAMIYQGFEFRVLDSDGVGIFVSVRKNN